ncbi:cell division protein FtsZ [Aureitalea marina]|uniref:Cell division protein FtsZ n=1 Tax=Aureitalea marina TaxID=930804 RepID=A0A2S7KM33_9FLAO|nr:cell division protein FtsZ [Aureitalea marina]PQB03687.1 cell division protein FtsZ [Aureitalea marina]
MPKKAEFENIAFDLPKNQSNVIKVIGVGGGGSNAINHMFSQGIKGVDFVICNTDAQALENSPVPIKIQLGVSLTEGLGAGANPKIGEQSAMESLEEIKAMLSTHTKMVFITAGMGGGTGTGAAPIIARMAKELDILTVGIVTSPFLFEGKLRNEQAQLGVENLRNNVDSLIVINNNKLREVYGNLGFKAGFSKADEVLATAARGIAEVITHHYTQNIDLRDAKTVLADSGTAIMGSAHATGANRAKEAISKALDSPLLNDNKINGAKNVLLLIVSGSEEITIDEIGEISDHIQDEAGHSANIIMGVGEDSSLEGAISITVIATGFDAEQQNEIVNAETTRIIHTLEDEQRAEHDLTATPMRSTVEVPLNTTTQESQSEEPEVIRHELFEDEPMTEVKDGGPFEGYVKTTELIKDIEVESTLIDIHYLAEFEQIQINEIDVNQFTIVEAEEEAVKDDRQEVEEQMLMFDLPINQPTQAEPVKMPESQPVAEEPELLVHNLEEIEVKDAVEIVPITEVSDEGVKRYSLDDYEEIENHLNSAKPSEEEVEFTTRTEEAPVEEEVDEENADPLNSPISKLLRDRTDERRRKMKEFNYKFRNSPSKIDEIEKQPAYKRMGIELDESDPSESNISRTSINTDDDDIDLRSNNSFLHDNVD